MADEHAPTNPYAGLEKALLRDTRATSEARPAPQVESSSSPVPTETPEITTEPRKRVSTDNSGRKAGRSTARFDLNDQPTAKYTLAFTEDELEALEDMKTQLRRKHGLKVAKNDLVRCGLHSILDALKDPDQASTVLDILASKKTNLTEITTFPWNHGNVETCFLVSMDTWNQGTVEAWNRVYMEPRNHGNVFPG